MDNKSQQQQKTANNDNDNTRIYLTDNSTLQTPEEQQADKNRKHSPADDVIETNTIEDVDIDALAGSDRAGTNERKP
jgi:hypothetical protein